MMKRSMSNDDSNQFHKKPKHSETTNRDNDLTENSSPTFVRIPESDRWEVTQYLGKGSYGSGHLAVTDEDDLPYEISVKSSRIMNEERFLLRLKSPFVVHEIREEKENPIRTRYNNSLLEYQCLAKHMKSHRGRGLAEKDVKGIAIDILLGLKYIHGQKVIHCDIKPKNILLTPEDKRIRANGFLAKMSGFGKAIEYNEGWGLMRVTIRFMSPELIRDMVLDYGADVWSFGCSVLEMLSGEKVWAEHGELDWEDWITLIGESNLVPYVPVSLSEEAKDFVYKCLEKDPTQRSSVESLMDHPFLKWNHIEEEEEEEEEEEAEYDDLGDADVEDEEKRIVNGEMADTESVNEAKEKKLWKAVFSVSGIMITLVIYGLLQEKIMRVPYGINKEYFKHSLFLVFCNRLTTSTVSAASLLANKKVLDPVAPVYKYCLISITNILTTTCQYEALKYVSFPVQTLAKCAKMIPVMLWGTLIMQKRYRVFDYLVAFLVTLGCFVFILFPAGDDVSPYNKGRENTVWGVSLMVGYLGFDGFTSTFQDKLFKGYNMEIHNQIFYTTLCSFILSFTGLILQGHLLPAVDFVSRHRDCLFDIALLSTVATASQFFISYTIRTFGALTFAAIMTTRQLLSIMLSCIWFSHPLSWEQCIGSVIVFGSLYAKNLVKKRSEKPQAAQELPHDEEAEPLKGNPYST
ncbi:hypothetical protein AALP_AA5G085100 [Arabis alpina]|uniref:Protein kinase domain-containing protein n=1 Tax=Arabis alpina TaxID=50452 RepID=A0A087GVR6_ARAAL|nr:hypothetical protein AALP_AA5G085100 [Arabis alpina]